LPRIRRWVSLRSRRRLILRIYQQREYGRIGADRSRDRVEQRRGAECGLAATGFPMPVL
jgi:hypothetical protein